MKKYKCLTGLMGIDGAASGAIIPLSDKQAAGLLKAGFIILVEEEKPVQKRESKAKRETRESKRKRQTRSG